MLPNEIHLFGSPASFLELLIALRSANTTTIDMAKAGSPVAILKYNIKIINKQKKYL